MIPKCLERKLAEVEALCSEHGLFSASVVLDEEDDGEEGDSQCVFHGDDSFGLSAAAILLRPFQAEKTELTEAMNELRIAEYESPEEGALDDDELPEDREDMRCDRDGDLLDS